MALLGLEKRCSLSGYVSSPILPIKLKYTKPKHFRYPTKIRTVGDEVRKVRIDRSLTQWDADDLVGAHRGFFNELEMNHKENSIYVLHKATKFLGYIPTILNIDFKEVGGKLYSYRIVKGYSLKYVSEQIGLDKSTLARFERDLKMKPESKEMIINYLSFI